MFSSSLFVITNRKITKDPQVETNNEYYFYFYFNLLQPENATDHEYIRLFLTILCYNKRI